MRFRQGFLAILTVAALLAAACSSQSTNTAPRPEAQKPDQTQAANPATKEGGTIRVAYSTEPSSLAPWRSGDTNTFYVYQAIYNSLVDQNENMEIVPGLAESWTVSSEGKTWTFKLRKGVKFQDGTDFDAEAVKFNVELWTTNAPKGAINTTADITGVKVIDPSTVELQIPAPNNQLLISLASKSRAILSPKAVKEMGEDFGRKPVGTGPFKFDKWVTDSTITVVKNPDYWEKDASGAKLPYLDKIEFKLIPDGTVRKTSLLSGEIDLDTAVAAENAEEVAAQKQFEIFNKPGMGYVGLRLLTTKPPFDKKEVRQALAWTTDREALNKAVMFGKGFAGYTMYSPPTPGFNKDAKPYGPRNVAKAKELLTQAGYPNGFEMDMIVSSPLFQTVAELLQAQYKEIGVKVNIKNLERGTFLDGIVKRQHQSYLDSLTGRSDPFQYYSHLECGATYNGHDYCNKDLDQMVKEANQKFTSLTDPQRLAVYQKAEQIVLEDVPFVPLLHPPILMAWNQNFKDVVVTPPGRTVWTRAYQGKK
jgi:peptide/nickel transport system substrate-binding protein